MHGWMDIGMDVTDCESASESDGFCTWNPHPTDADIGWLRHIPRWTVRLYGMLRMQIAAVLRLK